MPPFRPLSLAVGLLTAAIAPAIQVAGAQHPLMAARRSAARTRLFAIDSAHGRATQSRGLATGFVSYLAEDAVYLEPGAGPIHGKARIQSFLEQQPSGQRLRFHPALAEVSADGATGYTVGWTTLTVTEARHPPPPTDGSPWENEPAPARPGRSTRPPRLERCSRPTLPSPRCRSRGGPQSHSTSMPRRKLWRSARERTS